MSYIPASPLTVEELIVRLLKMPLTARVWMADDCCSADDTLCNGVRLRSGGAVQLINDAEIYPPTPPSDPPAQNPDDSCPHFFRADFVYPDADPPCLFCGLTFGRHRIPYVAANGPLSWDPPADRIKPPPAPPDKSATQLITDHKFTVNPRLSLSECSLCNQTLSLHA